MTNKDNGGVPHFAWTDKKLRACPFCNKKNTFCSLKWEERFFTADKRHMITASIVCHHCGATVSEHHPDVEMAIKYVTHKWEHRAGDDQ